MLRLGAYFKQLAGACRTPTVENEQPSNRSLVRCTRTRHLVRLWAGFCAVALLLSWSSGVRAQVQCEGFIAYKPSAAGAVTGPLSLEGVNGSALCQLASQTWLSPETSQFTFQGRNASLTGGACNYDEYAIRKSNGEVFLNWSPVAGIYPRTGNCKIYASAIPPTEGCTSNDVGDPVNPATCSVHASEQDISVTEGLGFRRFYNSKDSSTSSLSAGWLHSFSRTVKPVYSGSLFEPQVASAYNSSQYTDEVLACTSGFAEIKPRISTWANATSSYADGACLVKVGSTTIAQLRLYYTGVPTPAPGMAVVIGYDVRRDDGQIIRFTVSGGSITAPSGTSLKLQPISGGYTITDASDNIEAYDANGRLMSITSPSGVVQTMAYDTAGRLSAVTDNFGHSLTLTYDTQGRPSTVTRQ